MPNSCPDGFSCKMFQLIATVHIITTIPKENRGQTLSSPLIQSHEEIPTEILLTICIGRLQITTVKCIEAEHRDKTISKTKSEKPSLPCHSTKTCDTHMKYSHLNAEAPKEKMAVY